MPGGKKTNYEALFLADNNTPALLGTKAMQRANTILDLRDGKLHMWSGDTADIKIEAPSNTQRLQKFQLVQVSSGHLLLPCTSYMDKAPAHQSSASSSSEY